MRCDHNADPASGSRQSQEQVEAGREWIERSPDEKDLAVLVEKKLNMTWHCALADWKVSCVLDSITGTVTSRLREVILFLCSAPVRPYLEFCFQLWGLSTRQIWTCWTESREGH